jgi:hypothetical protein
MWRPFLGCGCGPRRLRGARRGADGDGGPLGGPAVAGGAVVSAVQTGSGGLAGRGWGGCRRAVSVTLVGVRGGRGLTSPRAEPQKRPAAGLFPLPRPALMRRGKARTGPGPAGITGRARAATGPAVRCERMLEARLPRPGSDERGQGASPQMAASSPTKSPRTGRRHAGAPRCRGTALPPVRWRPPAQRRRAASSSPARSPHHLGPSARSGPAPTSRS